MDTLVEKNPEVRYISAQPGMQTRALACPADGAIIGGSAGCSKTYTLLMESCRHSHDPKYTGAIFRRTSPEITSPGGLWDTAKEIYLANNVRAKMNDFNTTATFPKGGRVRMSHLQYEKNKHDWHGAQLAFIGFDELTQFTRTMFLYLLTRNRPAAGCHVKPYWRATCNPDADSWVREIISWYINEDTGYPIPERAGIVRYYTTVENRFVWVSKDWRDPNGNPPKSFTFIPGTLADNPILREQDPSYEATLYAQDYVTRERLLGGNWNVSYRGGMFNPDWLKKVDGSQVPKGIKLVRYWDLAASPKDEDQVKDPNNTAGVLMGVAHGDVYIVDCEAFQEGPGQTEKKMQNTAEIDGKAVVIGWEEEKGASGKHLSHHIKTKVLPEYECHADPVRGDKIERAKPLASLAEHGHVYIVKGGWNREYLAELGAFPIGQKKDRVDASSGALKMLGGLNHVWPTFQLDRLADFHIGWAKMQERPCLHYGAFWQGKDLSLWFVAAIWDALKGLLFVYDAFDTLDVSPTMIANTLAFRMHLREVECERLIGSDEMFAKKPNIKSTAKVLNMALSDGDIEPRICKPYMHDLDGSIIEVNRLLDQGRMYVHQKLSALARQIANWTIQKGKPDIADSGYCRALCLVVSELSQQEIYKRTMRGQDYKKIQKPRSVRGQEKPQERPGDKYIVQGLGYKGARLDY